MGLSHGLVMGAALLLLSLLPAEGHWHKFCYYNQTTMILNKVVKSSFGDCRACTPGPHKNVRGMYARTYTAWDFINHRYAENITDMVVTKDDKTEESYSYKLIVELSRTYQIFPNGTCWRFNHRTPITRACYPNPLTYMHSAKLGGTPTEVYRWTMKATGGGLEFHQVYAEKLPSGEFMPTVLNQYQTGDEDYLATYQYEDLVYGIDEAFLTPPNNCRPKEGLPFGHHLHRANPTWSLTQEQANAL